MKTKPDKEQIPINFSFISNKTFRNFITGENEIILETLKGLSKEKKTNIIFLRGDKSTGKTHLCLATLENFIGKKHYLSPSNISELESFNFSSLEFIIIDDLDKIITDFNKEEKIFSIINDLILRKKNILVTSTNHLNDIKFTIADLKSRLVWDQLLEISELDNDMKIKFLKKLSKDRGWILKSQVCDYIMNHYERDLYFLCNVIKNIDEKSLSMKKNITIPFVKKIMHYK
jgi:DnaA family protein